MAKVFRKISEARLVNFHFGGLSAWQSASFKLHAKLFRDNHFIYSIRDGSGRYSFTEFSTRPANYPLFGTIVIDSFRGKMLRVTREQMVKAARGKSGSYPSIGEAVSFNSDSKLSMVWNVIKLMGKKS